MDPIKIFPIRGPIPPDQFGYTRDPGHPYTFHLTTPTCKYQTSKDGCVGCNGQKNTIPWCSLLELSYTANRCLACDKREGSGLLILM